MQINDEYARHFGSVVLSPMYFDVGDMSVLS